MAPPSTTRTRTRATNPRRKPKKTHFKNQKMNHKKSPIPPASLSTKEEDLALSISSPTCSSSTLMKVDEDGDLEGVDASTISLCSTPKAERFRIPEVTTCPPAPKKPRMAPNCTILRTRPIAFFAPPDLELFFYALRDIPV